MSFKRSIVKLAAAVSIFLTGASAAAAVMPSSVKADEVVQASTTKQKRNKVVKLVKKQIGKPYIYGATGPSGFDCSGLTSYVYKNAVGKTLPRTTYSQIATGKSVSLKKLKKGDLLFWGNYHVGIYVGNGKFVHAPAPGQTVKEQTLASFYPSAAKRVL